MSEKDILAARIIHYWYDFKKNRSAPADKKCEDCGFPCTANICVRCCGRLMDRWMEIDEEGLEAKESVENGIH